ncbi:hypothetical protein E1B28_003636 [Marasmius oreades]|uniref:Uncharacterized protein n=1 Tax=Marasmius oreades TaxID=181124 RepID=A0A9P7UWX2_9AGAR|nr:uncharacterized protein E1B28_003636 [Marasmius oreades]KAG7096186.1 hypothetical protein E1B28_003636 [Marasmius oreades]
MGESEDGVGVDYKAGRVKDIQPVPAPPSRKHGPVTVNGNHVLPRSFATPLFGFRVPVEVYGCSDRTRFLLPASPTNATFIFITSGSPSLGVFRDTAEGELRWGQHPGMLQPEARFELWVGGGG